MTTIFLQRHGEYLNPRSIMPLRMPGIALSKKGRKQISSLVQFYKRQKVAAIYASPILRVKQTVKILVENLNEQVASSLESTQAHNHLAPKFAYELIEPYSPLQGLTLDEYSKRTKQITMYNEPMHIQNGGESAENVFDRFNSFILGILPKHINENIIVASHGDPMMIFSIKKKRAKLRLDLPIGKQAKFIPMGGILQLTLNVDGTLKNFKEVNY